MSVRFGSFFLLRCLIALFRNLNALGVVSLLPGATNCTLPVTLGLVFTPMYCSMALWIARDFCVSGFWLLELLNLAFLSNRYVVLFCATNGGSVEGRRICSQELAWFAFVSFGR